MSGRIPGFKKQMYNSKVGLEEAEAKNGIRAPQWKVG